MNHLTKIIEEEKEKIFTKYDFGYMNGSTVGVIEDLTNDLEQSMTKAMLAVVDEAIDGIGEYWSATDCTQYLINLKSTLTKE